MTIPNDFLPSVISEQKHIQNQNAQDQKATTSNQPTKPLSQKGKQ